jgi:hypothetical protein
MMPFSSTIAVCCLPPPISVDGENQYQSDVCEGQQLEEDAPAPRAPLLVERRRGELADQLAFPLLVFSHLPTP